MTKCLPLAALLLIAAPCARAASPLVGVWNRDGVPYAELRSDGRGEVDHEPMRWKADARILTLSYDRGEVQTMFYAIQGKSLTVLMNGKTYAYTRGAKAASPKNAPAAAAKAGKDELSKLLLSSAWCSFSYNKISGASHQERVVFRANGSWDSGGRAESYSSGAGGTVAGQSNSSSGGRWQVKGPSLLMSSGGAPLADTGLSVTRNSNGYPILKTGGKEYSSCN